jgi:Domain of unknown function (DUF5666)
MQPFASLRNILIALVIGFIAVPVLPAPAQQADVRIRGTIEKVDGKLLILHASDGAETSIALDSKTAVFINQPSSLSAIKAGDYVASAAVKGADGKLRSKELRIFPDALRGVGEGQRPMNAPGTLMTNASVSEVVAAPEGQVVKVKYKDSTADLIVGPQVPIIEVVPSEPSALKAGSQVFITATKSPDGTITATRILTMS